MSSVGIYPTVLVTTITIAASSAWTRRTNGNLMLECVAQGSAAGAAFAEDTHGLLGFGVDHFNRVTAPLIALLAHDQIPSWFDGDGFGVVAGRPTVALALLRVATLYDP